MGNCYKAVQQITEVPIDYNAATDSRVQGGAMCIEKLECGKFGDKQL